MFVKSMIGRLLVAGALTGLPAATALAADTVQDVDQQGPVELEPYTQAHDPSVAAHTQLASEAQANADKYNERAEMYKSFGACAYKTGEVQRAEQSAAKYQAQADENRALANQAAQATPAPAPAPEQSP